MGEEIVAADEEFETGMILPDFRDQTFGGIEFTILFVGAIGVLDLFGHQRNDWAAVGMHEGGLHHFMGVRSGAGMMVRDQAVGTGDFFRVKELSAIKGTIVKTVDVPIGGEMFSPLQTGEIILKNRTELLAVNGVDNLS